MAYGIWYLVYGSWYMINGKLLYSMVYDKYLEGLALGWARCSYDREQLGLAAAAAAAAVEAAILSLPSLPNSATATKSLPSSVTATNSCLDQRCPWATSGPAEHMLKDCIAVDNNDDEDDNNGMMTNSLLFAFPRGTFGPWP